MRDSIRRPSFLRLHLLSLLLPVLACSRCLAQAEATATKVSEFHVFAEGEYVHPDYGNPADTGIIAGATYTRFFRSPIEPSFEIRGSYAPKGEIVGQKVALGGVRADLRLRRLIRLHPYANFLLGVGEIDFTHPQLTGAGLYTSDNSVVLNYGGGVDYDLGFHGLSAQAEFQYQHWNIGDGTSPVVLTPYAFNAGLRYLIPFSRHDHR